MIRRTLSRLLRLGLVAGAVGGAVQLVRRRQSSNPRAAGSDPASMYAPPTSDSDGSDDSRGPEQALVEPTMLQDVVDRKVDAEGAGAAPTAEAPAWTEPDGDSCPASHPVKAKTSSKIFHVPGGTNYDRTTPDRCYRNEAAAEADGFRAAKR